MIKFYAPPIPLRIPGGANFVRRHGAIKFGTIIRQRNGEGFQRLTAPGAPRSPFWDYAVTRALLVN